MDRNRLLLDSSVLIAFLNQRDSQHKKAEALYERIKGKNKQLILHPLVAIETLTVLKMRLDREALLFIENQILFNQEIFSYEDHAVLSIESNSESFILFNEKNDLSFIDCELITYCLDKNIELVTFDQALQKLFRKRMGN